MIKNKSVALSITFLLIAVMLAITTIFAWFVSNSTINNITISTGEMKIEVISLELADDFNRDGILDFALDADNKPVPTYRKVDITTKLGSFSLPNNILPQDEFYYRMTVKNTGDFAGVFSVKYSLGDGSLILSDDKVDYKGFDSNGVALTICLKGNTADIYFKITFTHAVNSKPSETKATQRELTVIISQP